MGVPVLVAKLAMIMINGPNNTLLAYYELFRLMDNLNILPRPSTSSPNSKLRTTRRKSKNNNFSRITRNNAIKI